MARIICSVTLIGALLDLVDAKSLNAFGYNWDVRDTAGGKSGPGPNIFDAENVRTNEDGSLRFSLSSSAAGWHSSEATLQRSLGYGDYEFTIGQDVSALASGDSHVVFGLFLYKDDTHELDVEFARWGDAGVNANNADYVNQPNTGATKALMWKQPPEANTVHRIRYRPGRVDWASYKVGSEAAPFQTFTSTSAVPEAEGMLVHVNLWMFQGTSSWTGNNLDVSLSGFKFTAYSPASPSFLPEGCQGQAQCYVYESRAAAAQACRDAGHARLCDVAEATGHALCAGGWFADDEGYWMDVASEGCGHAGFNEFGGSAGAYCCDGAVAPLMV